MSRYSGILIILEDTLRMEDILSRIKTIKIKEGSSMLQNRSGRITDYSVNKWVINIEIKDSFIQAFFTFFREAADNDLTRCIHIYDYGYNAEDFFEYMVSENNKILSSLQELFPCIRYFLLTKEIANGVYLDDDKIRRYLKSNDKSIIEKYILQV